MAEDDAKTWMGPAEPNRWQTRKGGSRSTTAPWPRPGEVKARRKARRRKRRARRVKRIEQEHLKRRYPFHGDPGIRRRRRNIRA